MHSATNNFENIFTESKHLEQYFQKWLLRSFATDKFQSKLM